MNRSKLLTALALCVAIGGSALAQIPGAPKPEPAHVAGTVVDTNGDIVPGANVVLERGANQSEAVISNQNGFFQINDVVPGGPYKVTVSATGFASWQSENLELDPGQFDILSDIKLIILGEANSVTVVASTTEIAAQQVRLEEEQRVFGFIPNFYVSYDKNPAPLTSRLKLELAWKVSHDPVTFAATAFLAATNQAARYPNYQEGIKGYGKRLGAIYANDFTDILFGGAILPSILHQDPRYFYQGTGTTRSRLLHAISSPLICRGDDGRREPNFSSLGGYLASGAIANAYYPAANRGGRLILNTFAVNFSANIANGVLQEFVLRKLTPNAHDRN